MPPLLILTRPEAAARRFHMQVEAGLARKVEVLIAPLMRIDPVPFELAGAVAGVIFTSENGVARASQHPFPPGLPAYCVGPRTAAKARQAGFDALSAQGDSDALVQLLLEGRPKVPLVHLHGGETRGDIADRLTKAGLTCASVVCYMQTALPQTPELRRALQGERPLVAPLFSPRSAQLFGQLLPPAHAPVQVIAISPAVAKASRGFATGGLILADTPDGAAMVLATCRQLDRD